MEVELQRGSDDTKELSGKLTKSHSLVNPTTVALVTLRTGLALVGVETLPLTTRTPKTTVNSGKCAGVSFIATKGKERIEALINHVVSHFCTCRKVLTITFVRRASLVVRLVCLSVYIKYELTSVYALSPAHGVRTLEIVDTANSEVTVDGPDSRFSRAAEQLKMSVPLSTSPQDWDEGFIGTNI